MASKKFTPQLIRGNAMESLDEIGSSLKGRYEEEKKIELKVEPKAVRVAKRIWNIILNIIGGGFAVLGLVTLIHPLLRSRFCAVIVQFFVEAGLL